jgi:hypothetical protein
MMMHGTSLNTRPSRVVTKIESDPDYGPGMVVYGEPGVQCVRAATNSRVSFNSRSLLIARTHLNYRVHPGMDAAHQVVIAFAQPLHFGVLTWMYRGSDISGAVWTGS